MREKNPYSKSDSFFFGPQNKSSIFRPKVQLFVCLAGKMSASLQLVQVDLPVKDMNTPSFITASYKARAQVEVDEEETVSGCVSSCCTAGNFIIYFRVCIWITI